MFQIFSLDKSRACFSQNLNYAFLSISFAMMVDISKILWRSQISKIYEIYIP